MIGCSGKQDGPNGLKLKINFHSAISAQMTTSSRIQLLSFRSSLQNENKIKSVTVKLLCLLMSIFVMRFEIYSNHSINRSKNQS